MNLKKFANVDSLYRDLDTGQEVPWCDYMRRVIDKLGLDNIEPHIPYNLETLKEKLKHDINLNNTDIQMWDMAAGFVPVFNVKAKTMEYKSVNCSLADLFIRNGITCFSPSDGVCVLKEAARMLCEVMSP